MARRGDGKLQRLRDGRTDNAHPEKVRDPLFLTNPFFDAQDLLQVRYEMVRRVRADGRPVARTAAEFGVSPPTFYLAQRRFKERGLQGLLRLRSGPKRRRKVKDEILQFLQELRTAEGDLPYREMARRVEARFGVPIHFTTLLRALRSQGKKTRRRRPRALSRRMR
jgi:transposase